MYLPSLFPLPHQCHCLNRKLNIKFSVSVIVTSSGASLSTIYKFNSLVKFMCIVKAAKRGEVLTKCYEIKFTHKASLMTRRAKSDKDSTQTRTTTATTTVSGNKDVHAKKSCVSGSASSVA